MKDIISDVVDMIMEAKGSKKALSELLSSKTYSRIMKSMRVPDWVLLYFKLQTRLPDSAWQTLLNLTQLEKSKVMYNILDIINVQQFTITCKQPIAMDCQLPINIFLIYLKCT